MLLYIPNIGLAKRPLLHRTRIPERIYHHLSGNLVPQAAVQMTQAVATQAISTPAILTQAASGQGIDPQAFMLATTQPLRQRPIYSHPPLPLLIPMSHGIPYEVDISDFIDNLEDKIRVDEDSVLVAASDDKRTSLLLRPVAKAVAGPRGVAVASPVAKAVLRRGQPVSIDYDPDAVAIAGPGGSAEAHPKLVISYSKESSDAPSAENDAFQQTNPSQAGNDANPQGEAADPSVSRKIITMSAYN